MDADTVARELYAMRPGEFVAARDAKAAEARGAGDRALASEIKSMRRPTVSAWVTNLFALERGQRLEQLFSLGDALRAAQASLAGDELRRLDEQRRQVISALAGEAVALATEHGQAVPAQVSADVEQTLYAALADPEAAQSVKAGRLTTSLSYTGFGSASDAPDTTRKARRRDEDKEPDGRRGDPRRERLQEALQAAEAACEVAAGAVERAGRDLEDARSRREQRARAVDELESLLADARTQLDGADQDVSDAGDAVQRAEEALGDARSAVESARADVATD